MDGLTWGAALLFLSAIFTAAPPHESDSGLPRSSPEAAQTHFTQSTCAPSTPACSTTYGYCEHRDFGVAEWATLSQQPTFMYQYCDYYSPGYCVYLTPCDQQAASWLDQNYASAPFRNDIQTTFQQRIEMDGSMDFFYCQATFRYPTRYNRGTGPQCPLKTSFRYDDAGNLVEMTNNASP
jgi:hypothetical protein